MRSLFQATAWPEVSATVLAPGCLPLGARESSRTKLGLLTLHRTGAENFPFSTAWMLPSVFRHKFQHTVSTRTWPFEVHSLMRGERGGRSMKKLAGQKYENYSASYILPPRLRSECTHTRAKLGHILHQLWSSRFTRFRLAFDEDRRRRGGASINSGLLHQFSATCKSVFLVTVD